MFHWSCLSQDWGNFPNDQNTEQMYLFLQNTSQDILKRKHFFLLSKKNKQTNHTMFKGELNVPQSFSQASK